METPSTGTDWTDAIRANQGDERLYLIQKRPIVVWFSKTRQMIHRLIKITAKLGDDSWIICGFDNEEAAEKSSTVGPSNLNTCLRYLIPENGWVLCEFSNESSFYQAALKYLSQE